MKKITIFLALIVVTVALANVSFTQLNVETPSGVVAQPYFLDASSYQLQMDLLDWIGRTP